jgi:hypothetical protein
MFVAEPAASIGNKQFSPNSKILTQLRNNHWTSSGFLERTENASQSTSANDARTVLSALIVSPRITARGVSGSAARALAAREPGAGTAISTSICQSICVTPVGNGVTCAFRVRDLIAVNAKKSQALLDSELHAWPLP